MGMAVPAGKADRAAGSPAYGFPSPPGTPGGTRIQPALPLPVCCLGPGPGDIGCARWSGGSGGSSCIAQEAETVPRNRRAVRMVPVRFPETVFHRDGATSKEPGTSSGPGTVGKAHVRTHWFRKALQPRASKTHRACRPVVYPRKSAGNCPLLRPRRRGRAATRPGRPVRCPKGGIP